MSPSVIVPTEAPWKKETVIELDDSDDDPPSPATVSLVSIKKEKSASPAPLNQAPLVPQSLFVPSVNNGKSHQLHLDKSTPSFDFMAESDSSFLHSSTYSYQTPTGLPDSYQIGLGLRQFLYWLITIQIWYPSPSGVLVES